jgi:Glycosyl transferases group 1
MNRVLVLGGAPVDSWDASVPAQVAYGVPRFATRGYAAFSPPSIGRPTVFRLLGKVRPRVLRLYASLLVGQVGALRSARDADVIYSCGGPQWMFLFAALRRIGLLKAPLVCLAHQRPEQTFDAGAFAYTAPLLAAAMHGCDALPTLSAAVARDVAGLALRPNLSPTLPFGPDASWYPKPAYPGQGVVAVGMAERDFTTFGRAASLASCPATIVCPTEMARRLPRFGRNVRILCSQNAEFMPYVDVARLCAEARVHAIPLLANGRLSGLNSLTDALALGKPVIMTRIPEIDLDIEGAGVGRWVAPGDVEGWREAIRFFDDDPDEAVVFGRRARALVDEGFDADSFADRLMDLFDALLESAL